MRSTGEYKGAHLFMNNKITIQLEIDDVNELEKLEKLKDERLIISIKKQSNRRSVNANAYFWVLCDKIAKVLGCSKDEIYIHQLKSYGVFQDMECRREAVEAFKGLFRYVEEFDDGYEEMAFLRCYFGSSGYNSKEMSDLINGTVNDAQVLGIDTWTPDEIERACAAWGTESTALKK